MFCAKRIDIPFHLWWISNSSIWYIPHMMDHSISAIYIIFTLHEKESHTILNSIIYHVIKNRYASPSIVILHHKHVCLFAHSDRLQQCNKQIDHIFICKYFVSWLFVVFIRLTFFFCILQLGIIKNSLYLAAVFEGISCIPC